MILIPLRLIKELEIRGYEVIHCENNIQFDNYLAISLVTGIYCQVKLFGLSIVQLLIFTCLFTIIKEPIPYFGLFMIGNECGSHHSRIK